jgi:uncharacterized protein YdhG (YjbR/CyaY superfamily)
MTENKMRPTEESVDTYLETLSERRKKEARLLIELMEAISKEPPKLWGESIIGFGSMHYKYESGREGDMPVLAFSSRKSALTIYFEGFDSYGELLKKLGKHKTSLSCLYVNKLEDVDIEVLKKMLKQSYESSSKPDVKPATVEEYIETIPVAARKHFDDARTVIRDTLPTAEEVLSYGIVGYKVDDKRPRVFISGWKDHIGIYPIPKDEQLVRELKPYIRGKGTLWFPLDQPLPEELIKRSAKSLAEL